MLSDCCGVDLRPASSSCCSGFGCWSSRLDAVAGLMDSPGMSRRRRALLGSLTRILSSAATLSLLLGLVGHHARSPDRTRPWHNRYNHARCCSWHCWYCCLGDTAACSRAGCDRSPGQAPHRASLETLRHRGRRHFFQTATYALPRHRHPWHREHPAFRIHSQPGLAGSASTVIGVHHQHLSSSIGCTGCQWLPLCRRHLHQREDAAGR